MRAAEGPPGRLATRAACSWGVRDAGWATAVGTAIARGFAEGAADAAVGGGLTSLSTRGGRYDALLRSPRSRPLPPGVAAGVAAGDTRPEAAGPRPVPRGAAAGASAGGLADALTFGLNCRLKYKATGRYDVVGNAADGSVEHGAHLFPGRRIPWCAQAPVIRIQRLLGKMKDFRAANSVR